MGVELIESSIKKARKSHHCDYCGEIIEKGEEYDYQKNIFDGTFYEWHTHLACSHVASAIWDYVDPDDGMSDQDFMDGCQEVCQRFICLDCPEWDKEYGECNKDETSMRVLINRQDAIDALTENKEMINAVLDSLTLDYNTRRDQEQRRGQINEDIETIKALPSAQPEPSTEIQEILNYLDTTLHPIVSPDNWNVYSELYDMVSRLPSAQPEWNNHTVACLLAELFNDTCACNFSGIDEWLPEKCELLDSCPNPVGVACWEQYLKHRVERRTDE